MTTISITPVPSYDQLQVNEAVRIHMERFALADQLTSTTKVLLKPNLLMKRKPDEFTTTHPSVLEAVILWLKSIGVTNIVVADSPGGPYTESTLKSIYQTCGMTEVCKRQQVTLNLDTSSQKVRAPHGKLVQEFPLITPVCDADFIIDLCKLKTHGMTGLSGAVKNLFGTIPGLSKPSFHARFPDKAHFCSMLIDLCETVQPDFIFVDAIHAMEGAGPSGGTLRESNLLLASDNPYDLDYFLCHLIGAAPRSILTVEESITRGLCCDSLEKLHVQGEYTPLAPFLLPKDVSPDFTTSLPAFLQKPLQAFITRFLASRPQIQTEKCIGCGKCAESCPAHTISMKDGKANIYTKHCILCFCCHEMCPIKAIEIKHPHF